MNVLVIDPALTTWAYAVFDERGNLLCSKTISYTSKISQERRLYMIFEELDKLDYNIDHVIVERQFVDIMGQIVGVLRSFAGKKNIGSTMYVPTSWRKLLTGSGKATEEEIKNKVVQSYPEMENKSEHEIDCAAMFMAHKERKNVEKPKKRTKPKKH